MRGFIFLSFKYPFIVFRVTIFSFPTSLNYCHWCSKFLITNATCGRKLICNQQFFACLSFHHTRTNFVFLLLYLYKENKRDNSGVCSFSASLSATMLPLQERVPLKNSLQKLSDVLVLSLLLALLAYRLISLHRHAHIWLIAFTCESWFTFVWLLYMNATWIRVTYKTFPQHLSEMYDSTFDDAFDRSCCLPFVSCCLHSYHDLPAVDVFVTTADPTLEPPIITANTVLSLLAVEYPFHKLSCYVSDDAASPITFYSLVESAKFAKLWVPFCKKHNVRVRAPFVYFSTEPQPSHSPSSDYMREWRRIKVGRLL